MPTGGPKAIDQRLAHAHCAAQDHNFRAVSPLQICKGMSLASKMTGPKQAEVTYGFGVVVDAGFLAGRVRGHAGHGDHGAGEGYAEDRNEARAGLASTSALRLPQTRQSNPQARGAQAPRAAFEGSPQSLLRAILTYDKENVAMPEAGSHIAAGAANSRQTKPTETGVLNGFGMVGAMGFSRRRVFRSIAHGAALYRSRAA